MFKSVFVALLASMFLLGCANQRINIAGDIGAATPKVEDSQAFFVSGIGQKSTVDAAQVCGGASKVVGVAVEKTFLDGLLGTVTGGIYTPYTARVYCK